ncbi:hypothetical protein KQH82_11240 [bacterium]|nr:hypothetical protein [bacterium]
MKFSYNLPNDGCLFTAAPTPRPAEYGSSERYMREVAVKTHYRTDMVSFSNYDPLSQKS